MRKGDVIQLNGKTAIVKASTPNSRTALNNAKLKLHDKFSDLDGKSVEEIRVVMGEFWRTIAEHILTFPNGLPDIEWFADGDFEDKELRELEKDFLAV